jgi:hypothetical protein
MPISNYPNGFADGVTIRGVPLLSAYPGKVFWVDSNAGNSNNSGTFERPLPTIQAGVDKCTANKGDIVMVKPGHVETVAAAGGLDLNKAGIAIIGLGTGSLRPTVNFTTATTADMDVDAANITVYNLLFVGVVDALVAPIDINAADFTMLQCETRDTSATQVVDFIQTDATCDRLYIDGWIHRGDAAAGAQTALSIVGGAGITVKNFWIDGNFGTAAIENVTTAATNLSIYGDSVSYIRTRNSADVAITLVATATGNVGPNIFIRLQDDAANGAAATVGADMQFFQPILIVNADGESSAVTPITASVVA